MPDLTSALSLLTLVAGPLEAPVTEAVVYSDRARVTRSASVEAQDGMRVEFAPLPPGVAEASVRLEANGPATVDTIEIRPLGEVALPADEAARLLAAIERASDGIAQLQREQQLYTQLASVTDWRPTLDGDEAADDDPLGPRGRVGRRPKLDARGWRAGMAFLTGFAASMQARGRQADDRLLGLRAEQQQLRERARVLAAGPRDRRLRVVATLAGRGKTTLRLRYEVAGARWTPRYEVRLLAAEGRVTVALAGVVSQTTGEDWRDARLVLSTAVPYAAGLPGLAAWRIGEQERFIPTPRIAGDDAGTLPAVLPVRALESQQVGLRRLLLESAADDEGADTDPLEDGESDAAAAPVTKAETVVAPAGPGPDIGPGQLVGYVFDQTGSPLKGIKLMVSGGGGGLTSYSNEEGWFRFTGLAPGRYRLAASAPKMRTVTQDGIVVGDGPGAEVNLVMQVATAVEEVAVVERAPLVNTSRASVKQVFDLDMVGAFPRASRTTGFGPGSRSGARDSATLLSLAPPPGYRRVRLAADAPAVLAGGRDLTFPAARPETVLSGAGERRVPLATWQWPVSVERNLYPALADRAFLVATLRNPAADVLPAGPAALFVGADSVGSARLQLVVPGERFTLPLGEDLDVRPVRQVTVETQQRGLIWKDEISRYTVTTEIVNPHPRPLRVRVHDQIPTSPDRSVAVRLESASPKAAMDARTGEVSWSLDLAAGATTTVRLVYSLKRPKGHRLHQGGRP